MVIDHDGDRVVRFQTVNGQVVDHFVANGVTNLDGPYNAAYGPDGNLYVTASISNNITRYNGQTGQPLGELVPTGAGGLDVPTDIVLGPNEQFFYVSSFNTDRVKKVDVSTGVVTDFIVPGNGLDGPYGLAFDDQGNWYVGSNHTHRVLKYDSDGVYIEDAIPAGTLGLNVPRDVLIDAEGRLFVASRDTDTVIRKDLTTGVITQLFFPGTGGLDVPLYMTLGPDANALYVVGIGGNGQFNKYDRTTGSFLGSFLTPLSGGLSSGPTAAVFMPDVDECYADCDQNGSLNILDYICFGDDFAAGCP